MIKRKTGFTAKPSHYAKGREPIDQIRDCLGDDNFASWCHGCMVKHKICSENLSEHIPKIRSQIEMAKAVFYQRMAEHVLEGTPDPRSERPDFQPYKPQPYEPRANTSQDQAVEEIDNVLLFPR